MKNLKRFIQATEVTFTNRLPEKWQQRIRERIPAINQPVAEVRYSSYVPLIPVSIAAAYILDLPLAVFATSLYFLLGVIGAPGFFLFASGGGAGYWKEPGFGYLLGIIGGAWFAAWITPDETRRSWRQLLAASGGVTIAHLIGLSYYFGSSIGVLLFEGESAYLHFQPWLAEHIRNLTWYTVPYDLLFATILIAIAFPLRWLFAVLCSPDIANKHRPTVEAQLETLQESLV